MLILKDMKFQVENETLKVYIEKDRKAEATLSGFSAFRFAGACISAGYKIDGFTKERIGKILVELNRIKVHVDTNDKIDRIYESFTPDEFITIANYTKKMLKSNEIICSIQKENAFSFSINLSKNKLVVFDNQTMEMKAVNLNEFTKLRLASALELAVIGLLPNPVVIQGSENNLVISEVIIPDVELDEKHKENVNKIITAAKNNSLNQYALIRQYYKQQKIAYTRKILLKIGKGLNKIKVHLPVSYALAMHLFLKTAINFLKLRN